MHCKKSAVFDEVLEGPKCCHSASGGRDDVGGECNRDRSSSSSHWPVTASPLTNKEPHGSTYNDYTATEITGTQATKISSLTHVVTFKVLHKTSPQ